ncbi:MAG: SIMPL domain-containing protein [Acidimicrobiales bacterium]
MEPSSGLTPELPPGRPPEASPDAVAARPGAGGTPPVASRRRRRSFAGAAAGLAGAVGLAAGLLVTGSSGRGAADRAELTAATASGSTGAAAGARITVTGTATVDGTPDTLTVQVGATTNSPSATGALDQNNREVAAIEAVLASAGVAKADMQTSSLSLQPNLDSNGKVTGYQASDNLTVTVRDLARSGAVIDAAAHAAGNDAQIEGISFSISNTSALLAGARAAAVRDAEARAEVLASAAGATLGPVVSIVDQEQQGSNVVTPGTSFAVHGTGASPVPVQGGSEQLSVQVQVVYSLVS